MTVSVSRSRHRLHEFEERANHLLIKVENSIAGYGFAAHLLDSSVFPVQTQPEVIRKDGPDSLTIRIGRKADFEGDVESIKVDILAAGGKVMNSQSVPRGQTITVDASKWPDGPYEIRSLTIDQKELKLTAYAPWYKGDMLAAVKAAAQQAGSQSHPGDVREQGLILRINCRSVERQAGRRCRQGRKGD